MCVHFEGFERIYRKTKLVDFQCQQHSDTKISYLFFKEKMATHVDDERIHKELVFYFVTIKGINKVAGFNLSISRRRAYL